MAHKLLRLRLCDFLSTAVVLVLLVAQIRRTAAQTLADVCSHENEPNVGPSEELRDGQTVYKQIRYNQTHRWFYRSFNVTTMNQVDIYRKLMVNLEPCKGVVYLFIRKTRRCYPNPYSCIPSGKTSDCTWTHFSSTIDGSQAGTPTFFEVPLSSTKFYISVYAATNAAYTLTLLADIGAFPRPGSEGRVTARQLRNLQVQLSWDEAQFVPEGITSVKQYWVYSSMLMENDTRQNMNVFMRPEKIMNTVCGLVNNTDKAYEIVPASRCVASKCNATIMPVITDKRYVFNVVVESHRGFRMSYAGVIMRTDWEVIKQAASDKTLKVVGAVSGSVMGMVVIIYLLMIKLYG